MQRRGEKMKIQERLFWSSVKSPDHSSNIKELPSLVKINDEVMEFVQRQAYSLTAKRGGALFGFHEGGTIYLCMASSVGYPGWYGHERRLEINIDERFILGWSEAVNTIFFGVIDWIGNWIIMDDGILGSNDREKALFLEGVGTGLFDDRNVLLTAGWDGGEFKFRAYRYLIGEESHEIPCELGDSPLRHRFREVIANRF
jgi:hypothetical protein